MALRRLPPPPDEGPPAPSEYRVGLGAVRLHLNDVEDLVQYLRSTCAQVGIRAGDATADEATDLGEAHPRELRDVVVVTKAPDVLVRLARSTAYASTLDDGERAREAVDAVKRLLSVRRSWLAGWELLRWFAFPLFFALIVTTPLVFYATRNPSPDAVVTYTTSETALLALNAWLLMVLLLLMWASLERRRTGGAVIVPRWRGDARGLEEQKRTAWVVSLVGVLLTAVITFAATY